MGVTGRGGNLYEWIASGGNVAGGGVRGGGMTRSGVLRCESSGGGEVGEIRVGVTGRGGNLYEWIASGGNVAGGGVRGGGMTRSGVLRCESSGGGEVGEIRVDVTGRGGNLYEWVAGAGSVAGGSVRGGGMTRSGVLRCESSGGGEVGGIRMGVLTGRGGNLYEWIAGGGSVAGGSVRGGGMTRSGGLRCESRGGGEAVCIRAGVVTGNGKRVAEAGALHARGPPPLAGDQRHAHRAHHAVVGRHRDLLPQQVGERRGHSVVVGRAALEVNHLADLAAAHHAVQIIQRDGVGQAGHQVGNRFRPCAASR